MVFIMLFTERVQSGSCLKSAEVRGILLLECIQLEYFQQHYSRTHDHVKPIIRWAMGWEPMQHTGSKCVGCRATKLTAMPRGFDI